MIVTKRAAGGRSSAFYVGLPILALVLLRERRSIASENTFWAMALAGLGVRQRRLFASRAIRRAQARPAISPNGPGRFPGAGIAGAALFAFAGLAVRPAPALAWATPLLISARAVRRLVRKSFEARGGRRGFRATCCPAMAACSIGSTGWCSRPRQPCWCSAGPMKRSVRDPGRRHRIGGWFDARPDRAAQTKRFRSGCAHCRIAMSRSSRRRRDPHSRAPRRCRRRSCLPALRRQLAGTGSPRPVDHRRSAGSADGAPTGRWRRSSGWRAWAPRWRRSRREARWCSPTREPAGLDRRPGDRGGGAARRHDPSADSELLYVFRCFRLRPARAGAADHPHRRERG